jgi:putative ABC transport system permease protein
MNSWRARIVSVLMHAYPRDFREHYAASMAEHVDAEEGESFARTVFDVLKTSVTMRFENLWRDLTYAVRTNAKAPLYALVIVGTIALAVAANTVVFSLLDAVLLKPLPFADSAHLGILWEQPPQGMGQTFATLTDKQADAVASASRAFSALTYAMSPETVSAPGGATLNRVQAKSNYFATLGIRPVLGTFLTDGPPARQAVISSALWHARYGADARVLGEQIKLEGNSYTIVGVAPADMLDPSFTGLKQDDLWTKLPQLDKGTEIPVFPVVHLRAGMTWQAAQADLARLAHILKGSEAGLPGGTLHAGPLGDSIFSFARSFLWLVFAAVTGVLLIACANVANLLLARGAVRESEFAIRSALGASSRRIASQVLTETLLLAACGAAIGLAVAWFALPAARAAVPGNMPRVQTAGIGAPVLLYVLGLIVTVTLLTGMVPAYKRAQKGRRDAASRLRPVLVVVEIAVAFALTAGFGVMLHSFVSMTSVPLGFDSHNVYVANLHPTRDAMFSVKLTPPARPPVSAAEIERRVRAIPGVQDAAVATGAPFDNAFIMQLGMPSGWDGRPNGPPLLTSAMQVGSSYFRLLHIPVLAGTGFTSADFAKNTGSVIVNQAFARAYFPGGNAIGKRMGSSNGKWHVVAVVADVRTSFKRKPEPTIYMPFTGGYGPYFGVTLRTAHPVASLAKDVSAILRSASPMPANVDVTSLDDLVAQDASGMRTSLELLGALAAVALILGLCGIYSVVAYGTQRRFHEIGIRMAVGARPWNIISLVVGNALAQSAAGVAFGLVLFALTAQLLASQLYKTSPLDPFTLAGVVALIIACAGCAALIPACRAAFARPSSTLRYE